MPRYEYRCPDNGVTLEVSHPMSHDVRTWGELCERTERDRGSTPADAPVERVIGLPFVGASKPTPGATPQGGCGPGCGCVRH